MAKVKFEFDLIDESEEIKDFINGDKWRIAMLNVDERLRSTVKYGGSLFRDDKNATKSELKIAEKIREIIREELDLFGLKL